MFARKTVRPKFNMNHFEEQLENITPESRKFLQYLSLFYVTITFQEIQKLLSVSNLRTSGGEKFTSKDLSLLQSSLSKKGILKDAGSYWGKGFQIADENFKEILTREILAEGSFEEAVELIQTHFSRTEFSRFHHQDEHYNNRLLRDYRLSIYQRNTAKIADVFVEILDRDILDKTPQIVRKIFSDPFQKDFLASFERKFQADVLEGLIDERFHALKPCEKLWDFADEHKLLDFPMLKVMWIEDFIFKGNVEEAEKLVGTPENLGEIICSAMTYFLKKDYQKSVRAFEQSIKIWQQNTKKRKGFPIVWQMFFFGLALYKTNDSKFYKFAADFSKWSSSNDAENTTHQAINAVSHYLKNNESLAETSYSQIGSNDVYERFLKVIVAANVPFLKTPHNIRAFESSANDLDFKWMELECVNFWSKKDFFDDGEQFKKLKRQVDFEPVGNFIPQLADWERALNTLEIVAQKGGKQAPAGSKTGEMRVAWQIDFDYRRIQPVEQKYGKSGWTKGRNVALKRMFEKSVENMSEQDNAVVNSSLKRFNNYYGSDNFEFLWEKASEELIGHPFLFLWKNPFVNVQMISAEPNLVIREIDEELELSFDTKFETDGIIVRKETETRYKVINVTENHVDIAASLKNGKLRIPKEGRGKLLKAVQPLTKKIAIQSDLEEHFENLPSVKANEKIHALITPVGEGFHLEFFVKPFSKIPPYFKPGKGNESVIADVEGVRTRTKRSLKNERKLLNEIEESCPFLAEFESPNYDWNLSDTESCLKALSELETPREEGKLVVEWTKGQKLKLVGNINFENLKLSVKGNQDWFEIDGKVEINENLVLSMKDLGKLFTSETKEFVELSDGQFLSITEKLRKHLQSLYAVTDGNNRLHKLRSGILEDFADELEHFKTDKKWKEHLEKIKKASKFVPELPTTFEADLRPYQLEGYEWLSKLANWGVGACLADDMGLGKTIMALGLLVERAEKGAALVVAPVSVCRNWINEAKRFAPTLNFQIFGEGDRKTAVENLGKYDVLVTSYSLLQGEEKLFTEKDFATIVLDEAQAIKNKDTKRSKTVMNLNGAFRLITTGTPIENHLGELWNLFNFINPSLLGSHDFFNKKFAIPIEKQNDNDARQTLQRLIKPFILRRRKNQVLDDLPEKTEITLTVEMSPEERAFYESIRREALEKINSEDGEIQNKRFRILAELTKLRLACCHPKLVSENVDLESSKLKLFGKTLEELLENKHKALVFSQFVKHLKIVEEYLKKHNINYKYLDGSTPAKKRQERIDEFQRGDGEVFLISLKAGGTGLNLTAADYVIHLDPWWNPAVEDQATDRVHRIGQQRPVTVYRLLTEDTVEEKILKLHETKRDLADSLLDGTEASGKMSAEDLLALISEI